MYGCVCVCVCSPDHVLMVHLRQQLHLPSDAIHHLAPTANTDALDGVQPTIQMVTNLRDDKVGINWKPELKIYLGNLAPTLPHLPTLLHFLTPSPRLSYLHHVPKPSTPQHFQLLKLSIQPGSSKEIRPTGRPHNGVTTLELHGTVMRDGGGQWCEGGVTCDGASGGGTRL